MSSSGSSSSSAFSEWRRCTLLMRSLPDANSTLSARICRIAELPLGVQCLYGTTWLHNDAAAVSFELCFRDSDKRQRLMATEEL